MVWVAIENLLSGSSSPSVVNKIHSSKWSVEDEEGISMLKRGDHRQLKSGQLFHS